MPDFQFIAVRGPRKSADPATRKAVRQHVAKRHGKQKRLADAKRYLKTAAGGSKHSWRVGVKTVIPPESVQSSVSNSVTISPRSLLSASRTDPFESFPIYMQKVDLELIDFYMTDLARERYGPDLGESYSPMRDLFFAQAVEHVPATHGMLFVVASFATFMRPTMAADAQVAALRHRGHMLEQINSALARSEFSLPGLLQAIGFQVVYEGVVGTYYSCRRHLVGLRSIVLSMGGPISLNSQPRVQMIFIYLSFDAGPDYLPLPVKTTLGDPTGVPKIIYQTRTESAEVIGFISDTIYFLRQIQTLSERGWSYALVTEAGDFNPFGLNTIFYHILSPQWLPPTMVQDNVLSQHRTTRMGCLLLLCEALIALKAPSQACDDSLMQQVETMIIERADFRPDLRPILHLILKDPRMVRVRDLNVAYNASRNAQIMKRLSLPMHDKVGRLLLNCLAEDQANKESFSSDDYQRVRDEALMFQPP